MILFLLLAGLSSVSAYYIYRSFFGEVQGDHAMGIPVAVFVNADKDSKDKLKALVTDSFKRSAYLVVEPAA